MFRDCETPDRHHSYLIAYPGQSFQERRGVLLLLPDTHIDYT